MRANSEFALGTGSKSGERLERVHVIRLILHILFFLSGVAALGCQLIWSKMFSTGLGHEMPTVLAIVAAFMAGMALGAWWLDRLIPRDARAGLWFAGLELAIGAWALIISFISPSANHFALSLIGLSPNQFHHWLIAFAVPVLALLPATAAMGATLPAMEKFLSAMTRRNESIGSVYAANTLGAVVGTLLTPFVLMPALGFRKSSWVLVAVNGAAALSAWLLARTKPTAESSAQSLPKAGPKDTLNFATLGKPIPLRRLVITLLTTGLLGIGYETVGVRVLSQVLEGTVFTYSAALAIFLLGTALGASAFHRWWRTVEPQRLLVNLLTALSGASLAGILALAFSQQTYRFLRGLGDAPGAVMAAELLTAVTVFGLPTILMGAVFTHLLEQLRAQRGGVGEALALNTIGAATAPALVVILLPFIGAKWTLLAVSLGYLALALPHLSMRVAGLVGLLVLFVSFSNLRIVDAPRGSQIISYREGIMGTVAVTEDSGGARTLRVDNRYQMGGTTAADAEYRQAHLPLLLHPHPQRALFLGVGIGISLGAASLYPQLKVDGVELVPEVVDVLDLFEVKNYSAQRQTNFTLHVADARRFVRVVPERYDVIIADLFHPYRDGAGALYTREHFDAVRERLTTNGLFCQWLPLHQLDVPTLRVIVRSFESAFPDAEAWLLRFNVDVPVAALIGRRAPFDVPTDLVESRLDGTRLAGELKRLALADSIRLCGHWLAGRKELMAFAENSPVNTDDNQLVTFMAPRQAYQHTAKPYASLQALLTVSDRSITSAPKFNDAPAFNERLSRYLTARNVYLRGLVDDAEERREQAVDAYIESARLSADFTSGYSQSVTIASVIAASDPVRARRILERLAEARPDLPVAQQILERLFPK